MKTKYETKTSVQIEREQHKILSDCSEKTGRPIASLVEEALQTYIETVVPSDLAYAAERLKAMNKKPVSKIVRVTNREPAKLA